MEARIRDLLDEDFKDYLGNYEITVLLGGIVVKAEDGTEHYVKDKTPVGVWKAVAKDWLADPNVDKGPARHGKPKPKLPHFSVTTVQDTPPWKKGKYAPQKPIRSIPHQGVPEKELHIRYKLAFGIK